MTKVHHLEASAAQLIDALLTIENQQGGAYTEKVAVVSSVLNGAVAHVHEDISGPEQEESTIGFSPSTELDDSVTSTALAVISPPIVTTMNPTVLQNAVSGIAAEHAASIGGAGSHYFWTARGLRLFDPAVHKVLP